MIFIDTHCHIHSDDYPLETEKIYQQAIITGVTKLICVGTDVDDSKLAAKWAYSHKNSWASVGVHPHEAKKGIKGLEGVLKTKAWRPKIVAIGEIGLDYHYMHSSRKEQTTAFEAQLQLAVDNDLPAIFHVREAPKQDKSATGQAYDDFWAILNNFISAGQRIKGVLHSFTDNTTNLHKALAQDLFIGVNGIITFPNSKELQALLPQIPLHKLLLETDSPYLTPAPHRGTVNEPAYVRLVAERISNLYHLPLEKIAQQASHNATILFHI